MGAAAREVAGGSGAALCWAAKATTAAAAAREVAGGSEAASDWAAVDESDGGRKGQTPLLSECCKARKLGLKVPASRTAGWMQSCPRTKHAQLVSWHLVPGHTASLLRGQTSPHREHVGQGSTKNPCINSGPLCKEVNVPATTAATGAREVAEGSGASRNYSILAAG